ncbi:MAG: AMIN domain-containing protein, partial [Dictyoglomaceae bacterium]
MRFFRKVLLVLFLILNLTLITLAGITSLVSIQVKELTPGSMEVILFFSPPTIPKYNIALKGTQLLLNLEKVENKIRGKSLEINKGFLSKIDFQEDSKKEVLTLIFNFIGIVPKYAISTKLGSITLSLNPRVLVEAPKVTLPPSVSKEEKGEFKLVRITIDNKFKPPVIVINTENNLIPPYKTLLLKNPLRFVVDLENTLDKTSKKNFNINVSPFIGIRISQFSKEPLITRLVFDLKISYPKVNIKETSRGLVVGTEEILAKLPEKEIEKIEVKTMPITTTPKEEEIPKPSVPTDKFQQKVSLAFDRAEIRDVLKAMGQLVGINIITDISVQGRISVYLKDVTFKDAFYSLLAASDLGYVQHGDVLIVSTLDKMQKLESRNVTTKIFSLKYFDVKKAKDLVSNINKNLIVATEEDRNWLIISGASSEIAKVENFIKSLDVPMEKIITETPVPPEKIFVEKIGENIYLSANLKGEDIKEILQEIAKKTGKSIFIEKDVSGGVFVTFNRVPVDRALDLIIRGSGFGYEVKEGGEIVVGKKEGKTEITTLAPSELVKVERIGNKIYVTGELKRVEVREVLKELGRKAEINFVVDPKISGEVEFYVNRVPVEELLSLLGKIVGFSIERIGQISYVKPEEKVALPVELAKTKLYTLRYITLADLQRVGGQIVKNVNLSYDEKTGLLIAQGKEEDLKVLEELIGKIDVPRKEEETKVAKELVNVEKEGDKILISGELKGVDIKEVIREIGRKAGINFVIDPKVSGQVEIYLNRVELSEVMKMLSSIGNINIEEVDKVTYVRPREEKVALPVELAKTKLYTL